MFSPLLARRQACRKVGDYHGKVIRDGGKLPLTVAVKNQRHQTKRLRRPSALLGMAAARQRTALGRQPEAWAAGYQ